MPRPHSVSNPAHLHQVGDSVQQRGSDIASSMQRASMPGQALGPLGAGTASHIDSVLGNVHNSGQSMSSRMTRSGDTLHDNASAFEQNESVMTNSFTSIQPSRGGLRNPRRGSSGYSYSSANPSSSSYYTTRPSDDTYEGTSFHYYKPATDSYSPHPPTMPLPPPRDYSTLPYLGDPTAGRQGDMFGLPPSRPSGYTPSHANVIPRDPYDYDVETPASIEQRKSRKGKSKRPPHRASATVYDSSGQKITPTSYWTSGGMTDDQRALGYPTSTLSSHTEQQMIRDPTIQQAMGPGNVLRINGQYPPCPSCQTGMTRFAAQTGGTVHYSYPDEATGATRTWSSQAHISSPSQWESTYGYRPAPPW